MYAWLRPILENLLIGLVPVDGDAGRPGSAVEACETCPGARTVPARPQTEEAAWIPRAILYGPPL